MMRKVQKKLMNITNKKQKPAAAAKTPSKMSSAATSATGIKVNGFKKPSIAPVEEPDFINGIVNGIT